MKDDQPPVSSEDGQADSVNELQNIDALEMIDKLFKEDPQTEYLDLSGL